jgi:hypothetical protein
MDARARNDQRAPSIIHELNYLRVLNYERFRHNALFTWRRALAERFEHLVKMAHETSTKP